MLSLNRHLSTEHNAVVVILSPWIDYTYAIEVKNSVSFIEWIRHNARSSGKAVHSAPLFPMFLDNQSGAICKFLSCVTATQPSMQPATRCVP